MFHNINKHYNTVFLALAGFVSLTPLISSHVVYAASAVEEGFALPGLNYHGQGKSLHARNSAGADATVHDFLADNGWNSESLGTLISKSTVPTTDGQSILILEQKVDGFPVYGAQAKARFDAQGNLLELNGTLIETHGVLVPAKIEPIQALKVALGKVYPNHSSTLKEISRSDTEAVYGGDQFFSPNPKVTRVLVQENVGMVGQGFQVELWSQKDNQLNVILVSGSGELLEVQNRTADDSYNVFTENPDLTPQELVSPSGWLNDSTQYKTYIQGNNVKAYLDVDNNNFPDSAPETDIVSNGQFTSDATLESPGTANNRAVAVQNLFYFNNTIHDELVRYGFTLSSGNFQDADPVNAEAQDGGGTNNANFATPADGSSPRMQMYLWTLSSPFRDGDLDGDIVWHEYGHGLTWRTIGNMTGIMGGALGEGASDALSIIKYDDDVVGEYSYNNPIGIRTAPYGKYLQDTGRTYGSVCSGGCQVHRDGEIFAAIMWDMWDRYKKANTAIDKVAARDSIMKDFVGGMKEHQYQCSRPSFATVRNGILNAISPYSVTVTSPYSINSTTTVITPPAINDPNDPIRRRWCDTWQAFAKYGVGLDQDTTCTTSTTSISWSWSNGFSIPEACGVSTYTAPNAPSDLSATPISTSQINLKWKDNSEDETGFKIERCKGTLTTCSNFSQIATLGTGAGAYSDKKLQRNTSYTYRIRAYNVYGNSSYSGTAAAKTQ